APPPGRSGDDAIAVSDAAVSRRRTHPARSLARIRPRSVLRASRRDQPLPDRMTPLSWATSSQAHGTQDSIEPVAILGLEVASQCLQCITLLIDLLRCPEAKPAKDRQRWTPALDGVLEEKPRDNGRQGQPSTVHR